jgi:3-oxoacyl-[acyl-carrier-protein] synthase-1
VSRQAVYLNHVGLLCNAASELASLKDYLSATEMADVMTTTDAYSEHALPLGICSIDFPDLPFSEPEWQSRNNQFALYVYQQIRSQVEQAINRYGADRVGVVIGTSTSGISDSEAPIAAYAQQQPVPARYHYSVQEMGNTAAFIAKVAGVEGPVYGISTACSSGAKALASGKRLITSGVCDVVIAGGVDTLCQLTVQGFSSLEAVSKQ